MALAATPTAPCRREGAGGALTRVPAADTDLALMGKGGVTQIKLHTWLNAERSSDRLPLAWRRRKRFLPKLAAAGRRRKRFALWRLRASQVWSTRMHSPSLVNSHGILNPAPKPSLLHDASPRTLRHLLACGLVCVWAGGGLRLLGQTLDLRFPGQAAT